MELGLLANMTKISAQGSLRMTEAVCASMSSDALASLMERAGVPEAEVIALKQRAWREESAARNRETGASIMGIQEWQ